MTNNQDIHTIIDQWRAEQAKQSKREEMVGNIIMTVLTSCVLSVIIGWAMI